MVPRQPLIGWLSAFTTSTSRPCVSQQVGLPFLRPQRNFSSFTPKLARQYLGRITPKRIAVPRSALEGSSVIDASIPRRSIWRPIVFCVAFGGGGYTLLALYTNYDTQKWSEKLGGGSWWRRNVDQPSDREMIRAKQLEGAKNAQKLLNELPGTLSFLPNLILIPILRTYVMASEFYLNTPTAQLAPLGLIGMMGGIFMAWKIKRFEPFMRRWFLHRPVIFTTSARREWANCVTMFTSTISHQSFAHFGFNSFALFSFGAAAMTFLSSPPSIPSLPTATHAPHFFAFLLTAGLFSSLSSHLWTNIFRLPRLIKAITHPARISTPQALVSQAAILPSLGASGAIYAALTLTACSFPDSSVGIIFIPFLSIPIGWGVGGMVAMDLLGLIRGWRLFDHVAHLAGALFGFVYFAYGREIWAGTRRLLGAQGRKAGFA
nr:rhomboid-like protein [Cryptococcus tetragattii IND107]